MGAPDADILAAAIEILQKRIAAGTATFLVKVKAHRGEPAGAENEVQKHEEKLTGAWRQMSTLRRRYEKWCKGDDIQDCTHKQRYVESYQSMVKVLQQNTWIDDRKFLKSCVRGRAEQGNINHPAYGTWTSDFMLRQNECRAF